MTFQQGADDVFADIVDVPLDGGHQDAAAALKFLPLHLHLQAGETGLHGVGRLHDLGQEEDILLKTPPHLLQAGQKALVADLHRDQSLAQRLFHQGNDAVPVALDNRPGKPFADGQRAVGRRGLHRFRGLFAAIGLDVESRLAITVQEHHGRAPGIHHGPVLGVDDGGVQSGLHGHGEECRRDQRPLGQAKGDVADPQYRGEFQFLFDQPDGPQGFGGPFLFGADRQGQTVDDDVGIRYTVPPGGVADAAGDDQPPLGGIGNPLLVQGQADHGGPVLFGQRQHAAQALGLARYRVDQDLAVGRLESPLQGGRIGGIEHQRYAGCRGGAEHGPLHGCRLVDARRPYVHIQQGCSGSDLLHGLAADVGHLAFLEFLGIEFFPGGVDTLPDDGGFVASPHRCPA